jgi:hypothetical protein
MVTAENKTIARLGSDLGANSRPPMTRRINLPADADSKLRERAAAPGKDVAWFVQEAIEEKLGGGNQSQPKVLHQGSPEWLAEFNAWIASHSQQKHIADDSRDAIYGDERD